jgi:hypothetical protein
MKAAAMVDACVIADVDERYSGPWLEVADIIVCGRARLPCPAPQWISRMMATYPGLALAVVESGSGSVLGLRDGRSVSVSAGGRPLVAFLHYWLAAGNPVDALDGVIVRAGPRSRRRLRIRPGRWDRCE